MKYGNTFIETKANSFTPYHVFSNGKWYKSSILLSHTFPSKSTYLLYTIDKNLIYFLHSNNYF